MKQLCVKLCLISALGFVCANVRAQHLHFVAGAQSPTPGSKLIAVNSNDFTAASGFVLNMTLNTNGAYAGYYIANHSFIVAAVTPEHGGPEQGAPALGSWIHMGIDSITGPAGGEIGYWEGGATAPTIAFPVGQTITNRWRISENDGSPGSDPYGHIHGRRFSATKPGLYLIGFRFFDFSTNGVAGGPLHVASDPVYMVYQAGVTLSSPVKMGNSFSFKVGTQGGWIHTLQWSTNWQSQALWSDAASVTGDNHLQTLVDDTANQLRFYRVLSELPP